jgi:hypothetical protein
LSEKSLSQSGFRRAGGRPRLVASAAGVWRKRAEAVRQLQVDVRDESSVAPISLDTPAAD